MDENDIRQALGLEGENEQEPAAPAPEEPTEDPAPAEETVGQEAEAEPEEAPAGNREQTPEERGRQAYGRRQREREEAERRGADAERGKMSELLKRLGMKDPNTGDLVDSVEKLEAYENGLSKRRIADGRPTEDDIRRVVREEMKPEPAAEQKLTREEMRNLADRQIAEIHRLDPSVNTLDDILKGEFAEEFRAAVRDKGLSFVDAYRLAASGKLSARQQAAAEQAARNRTASKDHLSATATRGQGSIPVPRDQLEIFRAMMPGVSDAEFEKYYNKK